MDARGGSALYTRQKRGPADRRKSSKRSGTDRRRLSPNRRERTQGKAPAFPRGSCQGSGLPSLKEEGRGIPRAGGAPGRPPCWRGARLSACAPAWDCGPSWGAAGPGPRKRRRRSCSPQAERTPPVQTPFRVQPGGMEPRPCRSKPLPSPPPPKCRRACLKPQNPLWMRGTGGTNSPGNSRRVRRSARRTATGAGTSA